MQQEYIDSLTPDQKQTLWDNAVKRVKPMPESVPYSDRRQWEESELDRATLEQIDVDQRAAEALETRASVKYQASDIESNYLLPVTRQAVTKPGPVTTFAGLPLWSLPVLAVAVVALVMALNKRA